MPDTDSETGKCHRKKPHPIEYIIAALLFGTLLATGYGAYWTRSQVAVSQKQMAIQLRARLQVLPVYVQIIDGKHLAIVFDYHNSGVSDVDRSFNSYAADIFPRNDANRYDPAHWKFRQPTPMTVPPDFPVQLSAMSEDALISNGDIDKLTGGQLLIIKGELIYSDILIKGAIRHYCWMFNWANIQIGAAGWKAGVPKPIAFDECEGNYEDRPQE
jgi:hypothetical protein